jgi:GntR family transcriptional regulator/MocR family aminotransferase
MRLLYARRRARLASLIVEALGKEALSEYNDNAGLHLVLSLPAECDDVALARRANERVFWCGHCRGTTLAISR